MKALIFQAAVLVFSFMVFLIGVGKTKPYGETMLREIFRRLEQQAVGTIRKHVDALPDPGQRIDAATVAAQYALPGSALQQQAKGKLREISEEQSPVVPTQAAAARFVQAFRLG